MDGSLLVSGSSEQSRIMGLDGSVSSETRGVVGGDDLLDLFSAGVGIRGGLQRSGDGMNIVSTEESSFEFSEENGENLRVWAGLLFGEVGSETKKGGEQLGGGRRLIVASSVLCRFRKSCRKDLSPG